MIYEFISGRRRAQDRYCQRSRTQNYQGSHVMQIPFSINAVCRQTQNHNNNEIFLFSEQSELCCICLYYFGIEHTSNMYSKCRCTMQMYYANATQLNLKLILTSVHVHISCIHIALLRIRPNCIGLNIHSRSHSHSHSDSHSY